MQRVIAYIDGFNLYFGLRTHGWRRYYWLDLPGVSRSLLRPDQALETTHYFTSRIRDNGRNADDRLRQNGYIDALVERGVKVHEGHFLEKQRQCRKCSSSWPDYEEKMTDVNIAIQLLIDAFDDRFDTALLVSGDSDLTTPVKRVRERFSGKRVVVAFPPSRHSAQLQRAANGHLTIGEDKLRQNQLPDEVPTARGHVLKRPNHWR
jgi:uncharacterized LabA/DUF88 family protein